MQNPLHLFMQLLEKAKIHISILYFVKHQLQVHTSPGMLRCDCTLQLLSTQNTTPHCHLPAIHVRAHALHCLYTTKQWYCAAATKLQCIGHPQRHIYA